MLLDELAKYQDGAAVNFAVNVVALHLAGVILDLDDAVAGFLGEAPMPRIQPEESSKQESTPESAPEEF